MMKKTRLILVCALAAGIGLLAGCGKKTEPSAPAGAQVVKSSVIHSVKYDAGAQTLTINFTDGKTYVYKKVGQDIYDGLMKAESKGRFFHQNIKDKFEYSRL